MKAFPYVREVPSDQAGYKAYVHEDGMDLRDYFASDAMKELITLLANNSDIPNGDARRHEVSILAYKMADAMMKAREQQ